MGRYTSLQVFTDSNTKVVTGYKGSEPTVGGGNSSAAPAQPKRIHVEKVENIMGSCAGAGSSEFDIYRASRKRERMRLEAIDKDYEEEETRRQLIERVTKNKAEAEERTKKNSEKRKRKLEKKKIAIKSTKSLKVSTESVTTGAAILDSSDDLDEDSKLESDNILDKSINDMDGNQ